MLTNLVPWLHNVELVDPSLEPADGALTLSLPTKTAEGNAVRRRALKGEGWGSAEASQLVLNNLLYLTVTVSPSRQ